MIIETDSKISLDVRRCAECHCWYAQEHWKRWHCGSCLDKQLTQTCKSHAKLQNVIAGLRGALKRKARVRK